ncbi:hypothetical protein B0T17DRAFT_506757 [Bombardia bombarda]|uniref:Uncharacterized protein n=1 Tax=Bombardia bombarda TaxID=252184 RepID=A0AA39XAC6_9PEZI|nr:hypothetical protein B0T17DRAFT_506757 [Bombardia bombarda]
MRFHISPIQEGGTRVLFRPLVSQLARRQYTVPPGKIAKAYPQAEATIENHTMGHSLPRYLEMKVHQAVLERPYDEITVLGAHQRSTPSIIFKGEKRDKPFNWQRPTARVSPNGKHLYVECFPGYAHVEHYAEIIATYLGILQRQEGVNTDRLTHPSKVSFQPTSCSDTQKTLLENTNLKDLPEGIDTVILGHVDRLEKLTGKVDWAQTEHQCCSWVVRKFNGRKVAFVGFRPNFWGDISGEVVHFLASRRGVKEVIYLGKLGSVKKGVRPNTYLATGGQSLVHGQVVEWDNTLSGSAARVGGDYVTPGNHMVVRSVLHETKDWLASLHSSVDFIDPEIGMMGQAAVKSGIRYGYLHIISDNVAEKYAEDLSNERQRSVLERRAKLYDVVQDVLGHHLSRPVV